MKRTQAGGFVMVEKADPQFYKVMGPPYVAFCPHLHAPKQDPN
jgi:hypothetical protein